jgi:O-antigen ligase
MWPNKWFEVDFWRNDVLLWLSMGFIHVSTALSSICLGIFILQLLVLGVRVEMSTRQIWGFGLMAMALLWNFVCLFDSVSMGWFSQAFASDRAAADLQKLAWVKMQVKLPLFIVLGLYATGRRLPSVLFSAWPVLLLPMIWVSASSVIHYFQHRAFYDQMVLESKPIPLYSNVYHIEYAVMVGMAVLLMLYGWMNGKIADKESSRWLGLSLLLLVVCMHILGARTGLVVLYSGGGLLALQFLKKNRKWMMRTAVFGACGLGLLLMMPSVQNRIQNTWVDLKTTFEGGDLTHQSFGQRWVAWNTAFETLNVRKMVVSGYGVGVDEMLKQRYERGEVALAERHRIGVHNQWLEGALQSGWLPMLLVLVMGFVVMRNGNSMGGTSATGLWLALVLALMFESLFERQAGILVVLALFQGQIAEKNGMNSKIKKDYALNDEIK